MNNGENENRNDSNDTEQFGGETKKKPKHLARFIICRIFLPLIVGPAIMGAVLLYIHMDIHKAAERGDIATIKICLFFGADIEAQNNLGRTPLDKAVESEQKETVKFLLEQGADPNCKSSHSLSDIPLHNAIYKEQYDIAQMLIDYGADANAQDDFGETPLIMAVSSEQIEIVKLLLENGANPNRACSDILTRTPLQIAMDKQQYDIAQTLIDCGADVNAPEKNFDFLLFWSIIRKDIKAIRFLLGNGADVNLLNNKGMTPLDYAAIFRDSDKEIIEILKKAGAKTALELKEEAEAQPNSE